MSQYKNIFINSEISKIVLKSIINKKKINFKKLGIPELKKKIIDLSKVYEKREKKIKNIKYKYQIFWNIVEEIYNKKIGIVKRFQNKKKKIII